MSKNLEVGVFARVYLVFTRIAAAVVAIVTLVSNSEDIS
jgi:hypothetical protein